MSAKPLAFGQKLPGSSTDYLRVKISGEKVQFRIGQEPVFIGKHFMQEVGEDGSLKWNIFECPRMMENGECETCDQFFELMAMVKKFKAAEKVDDNHPEVKRMKEDARKFAVTIEVYLPILNRNDGKFAILQTTNGVKNKWEAMFADGVDVMAKEWVLRNTGSKVPSERYSLSMVDSADVKPLTPEEEDEFKKAKTYDLSSISSVGGNRDSDE